MGHPSATVHTDDTLANTLRLELVNSWSDMGCGHAAETGSRD